MTQLWKAIQLCCSWVVKETLAIWGKVAALWGEVAAQKTLNTVQAEGAVTSAANITKIGIFSKIIGTIGRSLWVAIAWIPALLGIIASAIQGIVDFAVILIPALEGIISTVEGIAAAFGLVSNPVGWIILAVAAIGAAIYFLWNPIKDLWGWIGKTTGLWGGVTDEIKEQKDTINDVNKEIKKNNDEQVDATKKVNKEIKNNINTIKDGNQTIEDQKQQNFENDKQRTLAAKKGFKTITQSQLDALKTFAEAHQKAMKKSDEDAFKFRIKNFEEQEAEIRTKKLSESALESARTANLFNKEKQEQLNNLDSRFQESQSKGIVDLINNIKDPAYKVLEDIITKTIQHPIDLLTPEGIKEFHNLMNKPNVDTVPTVKSMENNYGLKPKKDEEEIIIFKRAVSLLEGIHGHTKEVADDDGVEKAINSLTKCLETQPSDAGLARMANQWA